MTNIAIVGKGEFVGETKWLIDRINQGKERWRFIGYIDKKMLSGMMTISYIHEKTGFSFSNRKRESEN